jgi:hypothetical protein
MSGHDDNPVGSVSRRRMLGRIGATSVLVWSAPALTSISSPAWAQGSPPPPGCRATNGFCGGDFGPLCLDGGCQPGVTCGACTLTNDGCLCHNVVTCKTGEPTCQSNADCEAIRPGSICGPLKPCDTDLCFDNTACFSPCQPGSAPRRAPAQQEGVISVYLH